MDCRVSMSSVKHKSKYKLVLLYATVSYSQIQLTSDDELWFELEHSSVGIENSDIKQTHHSAVIS